MTYHRSMLPLGQMASGDGVFSGLGQMASGDGVFSGLGCGPGSPPGVKSVGCLGMRGLRGLRGLGALGWPYDEQASYGYLADPDLIQPTKPLCGSAALIQKALKDQGFYAGAIDGILGKGSVSAIAAFSKANNLGNVSWPNPTFCMALQGKQHALLQAEFEKRHPQGATVAPDGTIVDNVGNVTVPVTPGSGTPGTPGTPVQVPSGDDQTRTYLMIGGFGLAAALALGLVVYAAKSGGHEGGGGAAYTANRRGGKKRRRKGKRGRKHGRRHPTGRRGRKAQVWVKGKSLSSMDEDEVYDAMREFGGSPIGQSNRMGLDAVWEVPGPRVRPLMGRMKGQFGKLMRSRRLKIEVCGSKGCR